MKLGLIVRNLRTRKGYTQTSLSEKSGISLRTIQRIENDEVSPSIHTLKRIEIVLDEDLIQFKDFKMKTKLELKPSSILFLSISIILISLGVFYLGKKDSRIEPMIVKGYPIEVVEGYPIEVVEGYPIPNENNKEEESKFVDGYSIEVNE